MNQLSHRQTTLRLRLTHPDGTPIAGAPVQADQTSHQFLFGCGAFDTVAMMKTADERQRAFLGDRMEKWLGLFNYGTLPFYWGRYEPREGSPAFESTMNAARLLVENGARLKGHPLCWHTVCADWLMQYDDKTILDKQLARIHRDVSAFAGVIDIWDVINEVVIMPEFDRYDNAITRVCKRYGRVPLVKALFDEAHAADPDAKLLLNDFNTGEEYRQLIEGLGKRKTGDDSLSFGEKETGTIKSGKDKEPRSVYTFSIHHLPSPALRRYSDENTVNNRAHHRNDGPCCIYNIYKGTRALA
jgi:hypothetical protein